MAAVLDAVTPLVRLLSQATDPQRAAAAALGAAQNGNRDQVVAVLREHVTDTRLVTPALTFAGVLTESGDLTAEAPVRLGQAAVLLEAAEVVWAPGWDLVLTVPGFLRDAFADLTAAAGGARPVRETGQAMLEIANAARSRLIVASPFLHMGFVQYLAGPVERVLSGGGEVLVLTRALSLTSPEQSSANLEAVTVLRNAGVRAGRAVTVRSWEESGLGLHFKVVTADEDLAYLGSANLTLAGAAGGHAEAGVLLRGRGVTVLTGWLRVVAEELTCRRLPSA
jgi:hypothetical protein